MKLTVKTIFALALMAGIYSCKSEPKKPQSFEVNHKGALKNIMHKGDLTAKTKLAAYSNIPHLYALGAIENLKGEIQIFDGEAYNSYVENGAIKFDSTYSKSATLLVTASVEKWISVAIPNDIISKDDLESYMKKVATKHNIDPDRPFPFLIEGIAAEIDWHVIDWKDGDTEHSHEKHISSGLQGKLQNQQATFLGFYSNAHHAVFTHHTTNMHIHMKLADGQIAGHVDGLKLGKKMMLKLPINETTL